MNKTWFLAAAALGIFATQGMIQIVPPLLVEIASDFKISVAVAGQLVTATFAAWAVSVVSVGPLSDTFGRRPVAIFGLLALSVSVLASAFAPNIELLLALRVLSGLGDGAIPPNTVGAVADVIPPERRAQAVSAMLAIGMLSSVIMVPIVALLADWGGWRIAFVASGLLPAAGLLANWFWFPRSARERVRDFSFSLKVSLATFLKPESTERSGEGAGTGRHRDGEETVPADMGRSGPVAGLLAVRVAAHEVAVGSKELSLADSCGASG